MSKAMIKCGGLLSVALSILVAGCCGDVESKLNKCNKNLKATNEKLDQAEAHSVRLARLLKGTRGNLKDAEAQNSMLTKRLELLGQDVEALKAKGALSEEEKARLAKRLAESRRQMAELKRRQAQAEARARQFRELLRKFSAMIKAGKIKVTVRDGRMVVQLPDKVLFPSGKSKLKRGGKKALETVTHILRSITGRKFQVAGHTDSDRIRTRRFPSNWELSTARAVNVAKYMQKMGMKPERLSAAGYAQFSPVAANDSPENKALNRRIEIVLQPDLAELPSLQGLLPGK